VRVVISASGSLAGCAAGVAADGAEPGAEETADVFAGESTPGAADSEVVPGVAASVPDAPSGVPGFAGVALAAGGLLDAAALAPATLVIVVPAPPFSGATPGAVTSDRAGAGGVVPGDDGLGDGALDGAALADGELDNGAFTGGALAGGGFGAGPVCGGAVDGLFFSSEGR
jgi:hypothetical protein